MASASPLGALQPASAAAAASVSAASAASRSRSDDLKTVILQAILAERARKASRIAAGLPSTDESSSDSGSGSDAESAGSAAVSDVTKPKPKRSSAAARAPHSRGLAASAAPALSKSDYGQAAYWDARYAKTSGVFDWYCAYADLAPLLDEFGEKAWKAAPAATAEAVSASSSASASSSHRSHLRVLDVGCGNSALGADMSLAGWAKLTHIDLSSVVIADMVKLYRDVEGSHGTWLAMDATQMTFDAASFDLIIEKGTMDALDCTPSEAEVCRAILAECSRVLRPGGVLLLVTHGHPRRRLPLLRREEFTWKVETRAIAYSNSSLFIRLLRQKLPKGIPLSQAPAAVIAQCAAEVRDTKLQVEAELARAQACIARVEAEFNARSGDEAADGNADAEESEVFSPATSSVCFAYACTKL